MEDSLSEDSALLYPKALLSEIKENGGKPSRFLPVDEDVIFAGPYQLEHGEASVVPKWFAQKYTHEFVGIARELVRNSIAHGQDMLAVPPDELIHQQGYSDLVDVVRKIQLESLEVKRQTVESAIPSVVRAVLGAPKRALLQYLGMEKGKVLIISNDKVLVPRLTTAYLCTPRCTDIDIATTDDALLKSYRTHTSEGNMSFNCMRLESVDWETPQYNLVYFDENLHRLGRTTPLLSDLLGKVRSSLLPEGRVIAMVPDPRGVLTVQQLPAPTTKIIHVEALYPPSTENEDGVALTRLANADLFPDPMLSLSRLSKVARDLGLGVVSGSPREFFAHPDRTRAVQSQKIRNLLGRKENCFQQIIEMNTGLPSLDICSQPLGKRKIYSFTAMDKQKLPRKLTDTPLAKGRIFHYEDIPWFRNGYYVIAKKLDGISARFLYSPSTDPNHSLLYVLGDDGTCGMMNFACPCPHEIVFTGEILHNQPGTGLTFKLDFKVFDVARIGVLDNLGFSSRMSFLMIANNTYEMGLSFQRFYPSSRLDEVYAFAKKERWEGLVFQQLYVEYGPFSMSLHPVLKSQYCGPARYLKFEKTIDVGSDSVEAVGTPTSSGSFLPPIHGSVVTVNLATKTLVPYGTSYYRKDKRRPNSPELIDFIKSSPSHREVFEALAPEPLLAYDASEVDGLYDFMTTGKISEGFKIGLALTYPCAIRFPTSVKFHQVQAVYKLRLVEWEQLRTNPAF